MLKIEEIKDLAKNLQTREKVRFSNLPYFLSRWAKDHGGLEGKRILDFGCGSGFSTAGLSLLHSAELAVGVDINSEAEECKTFLSSNFGIERLPQNLVFERIKPGQTTSFEEFDCIFSWSVFEHIDIQLYPEILAELRRKLKPGGIFFVQISPLYFSPEGSHLWEIGYGQWEHLLKKESDVYLDIMTTSTLPSSKKNELWSMFQSLNRIKADELIDRFNRVGLKLIRQRRDSVNFQPPTGLLDKYSDDTLTNYQVVALFQKN